MRSTRELYGVFSRNLRILASAHGSVAELCRALGVNRTQFNRYLSGQASPRPEVLLRICTYFETDARILLQPIEDLHPVQPPADRSEPFHAIFDYLYRGRELLELRSPPPMGIHRYWQRSSIDNNWVNSYTVRLFRRTGATLFRAIEDRGRDGTRDRPTQARRDVRGWMMDQDDGIIMQAFQPQGKRLSFGFLTYPPTTDKVIYPGLVMLSRPSTRQVSRLEHCALEILPQGEALFPVLRERGGRPLGDLPASLAKVLSGTIN